MWNGVPLELEFNYPLDFAAATAGFNRRFYATTGKR